MKILINNEEIVCNYDFTIEEELKNVSSVVLSNVYPKSWELTKDYTNNYYHPNIYSKVVIYDDDENKIFTGVVANSGEISLNPRDPHYCDLEIVDYTTFLSESKTLDFVIANKTIQQAIEMIINEISEYGFALGNVDLESANDLMGSYSTLDKTAYDVFNYISDITGCRWFTRPVGDKVYIDFYDASSLPSGSPIEYTKEYWEANNIDDISYSYNSYDYRNRQVMTADKVLATSTQREVISIPSNADSFLTGYEIGNIVSITTNGVESSFATNNDKDIGVIADYYYTSGNNTITSNETMGTGTLIIIEYYPMVKGREVITNQEEIMRVANSTGTSGKIARYEKRSDTTDSGELQKIGSSYLKYKGVPSIQLTISCESFNWELGQQVHFNAPIEDLNTDYLVKKISINYIATINKIFYTYTLDSSFNEETEINYFDNQRYKKEGNIEEGSYIDRNIDIESMAQIIFYDTELIEV